MCMTGALFNHFQQSPGSPRSDIRKILCRPRWTWVRGGLQGTIELCPRLFPAFGRFVVCFPNGFYMFKNAFGSSRSPGLGCDPLLNMRNISFTAVHCDELSFRLHGVIITKTSKQKTCYLLELTCANVRFADTGNMF